MKSKPKAINPGKKNYKIWIRPPGIIIFNPQYTPDPTLKINKDRLFFHANLIVKIAV